MKINGQFSVTLDGGGIVTIAVDSDTLIDPADKGMLADLFKTVGYRVERPEGQEAHDIAALRAEFERVSSEAAALRANCSQLEAALARGNTDRAFLGVVGVPEETQ